MQPIEKLVRDIQNANEEHAYRVCRNKQRGAMMFWFLFIVVCASVLVAYWRATS